MLSFKVMINSILKIVLVKVYPCGTVLNAIAERAISEKWTSQ